MTYPSIKETFYRASSDKSVVLTVPHGSNAHDFLQFFPEIRADPELQKVWPLFETYLAIEQDVGAIELAHAIAYELLQAGVAARVVELNYPRGIVDGGRLRDHCLRNCLPSKLFEALKPSFIKIHDTSLAYMDRLYEGMANTNSYLIDIHTMASFCPVDETGRKFTFPVSFPRLKEYTNQYLEAQNHAYQRKIDLICANEKGEKLADPLLLQCITEELTKDSYEHLENEPYHAAPIYLSHQHMQMVPSLSIDIPKHLVASEDNYQLHELSLDPKSISSLAQSLARGVLSAFSRKA